MESVMMPRFWVMYSMSSVSAARFTSFDFRSLNGSRRKSNTTQHCRIFCTNRSSLSATGTSTQQRTTPVITTHPTHPHPSIHYTFVAFLAANRGPRGISNCKCIETMQYTCNSLSNFIFPLRLSIIHNNSISFLAYINSQKFSISYVENNPQ